MMASNTGSNSWRSIQPVIGDVWNQGAHANHVMSDASSAIASAASGPFEIHHRTTPAMNGVSRANGA
jgi:hypothetical protein